jgi:outer membrane receptor protein involved in Fe transport
MKKIYFPTLAVLFTLIMAVSGSWAQDPAAESEFSLEEITVTAEKRVQNLQETPSSVTAIDGGSLMEFGKTTTSEILQNIPNIMYGQYGSGKDVVGYNPDGGISIRGLKYRQRGEGHSPSATATYVDGVFQGIGGNFDISRVEVLRGPQGTLYGRSATAGVVAFYTQQPGFVSV